MPCTDRWTSTRCARLAPLGLPVLGAVSRAPDRATYLQRPDLGRALAPESAEHLAGEPSALAVERHAPSLLEAVLTPLRAQGAGRRSRPGA